MPEKIYWGFARLFLRNDISLFFFDFLKDTACPCSFRGLTPKQDRQPSSQKRGICHKKEIFSHCPGARGWIVSRLRYMQPGLLGDNQLPNLGSDLKNHGSRCLMILMEARASGRLPSRPRSWYAGPSSLSNDFLHGVNPGQRPLTALALCAPHNPDSTADHPRLPCCAQP